MKSPKNSHPAFPYQVLFIANDKGGTRKSSLLIFILAILIMAKMRAHAYEIDDQGRVARLYGDLVTTLALPDTDSLSKSSLGDTAILAPLLDALIAPAEGRTIVIEVGANMAERVAFALKSNLIGRLIPAETKIGIMTPIDNSDDSIILGARSGRLIKNALPQAEIIVVQPRANLGSEPSGAGMSAAAKASFAEVFEPVVQASGALVWPLMTPDLRHAFEAMRLNPLDLLAADHLSLGRAGYDAARMDFVQSDQSLSWMGRKLHTEFQLYLASLMEETQRMLGFPSDPE